MLGRCLVPSSHSPAANLQGNSDALAWLMNVNWFSRDGLGFEKDGFPLIFGDDAACENPCTIRRGGSGLLCGQAEIFVRIIMGWVF